jgi:hypothetical protein
MEMLRTYTYIAHVQHFCNNCCRYIQPGEQYEGIVYVHKKHGIIVTKQHVNPACDFPPDEFEDFISSSKDLENSVREDVSFNAAA